MTTPTTADGNSRPVKTLQFRRADELRPYERNARKHSEAQVAQLAEAMRAWGFTNPLLIDGDGIVAGHGRLLAAQKIYADGKRLRLPPGEDVPPGEPMGELLPEGCIPVLSCAGWTDEQRRAYVIADNQLALNAEWDTEILAVELGALQDLSVDLPSLGFSEDELAQLLGIGDEPASGGKGSSGSLAERFMVPPFSVLNAREGWWQERKRAWLALGIKSELGRGGQAGMPSHGPTVTQNADGTLNYRGASRDAWDRPRPNAAPGGSARPAADYSPQRGHDEQRGDGAGKKAGKAQAMRTDSIGSPGSFAQQEQSGTSIFDPVLTELAYRWFSAPGAVVLDPFAGGSVRGIVASRLGRAYVGHELRAEQVDANREQAAALCQAGDPQPRWIAGDSRTLDATCSDVDADLVFSCPPYADLEVYSDDPADLSTMDYAAFRDAYREIIAKACARLRDDRFACFVVGEVRDRRGCYVDFVGDTVQAFRDAGLAYYNEAILVTALGSLPIRTGKQFAAGRKLGKTHQNVLVFVKGDPRKAADACGPVVVDDALRAAAEQAGEPGGDELPADGAEAEQAPAGPPGTYPVKISAKSARLEFAGCDPDYIRDVCHASCCQSSVAPGGTKITIHPTETARIEARGGVVVDGLLQSVNKRCPFKTAADLCGLHRTADKPFGCIASPFTLNDGGTLIVRNRYRMLKCFKDGRRLPAYVAFRASLDLIFGADESLRIVEHLEAGGGDMVAHMPAAARAMLLDNDEIKRAAAAEH